ncbi:hypothetical protein [Candidatus Halocynthiibacter alkanivorans]|uniref:hypothetical protein n=1 Tax=Candidatus Halocynthiibacter alkanivorans TaxID=2267619 RepID=UPI000DF423D3|nr:hypothetical protein [Candidatus Halocynthiibacter alkanivorans]
MNGDVAAQIRSDVRQMLAVSGSFVGTTAVLLALSVQYLAFLSAPLIVLSSLLGGMLVSVLLRRLFIQKRRKQRLQTEKEMRTAREEKTQARLRAMRRGFQTK